MGILTIGSSSAMVYSVVPYSGNRSVYKQYTLEFAPSHHVARESIIIEIKAYNKTFGDRYSISYMNGFDNVKKDDRYHAGTKKEALNAIKWIIDNKINID